MMQLTPSSITAWLQKWQSNGVRVNSRELLYYRQAPLRPPFRMNKGVSSQLGTLKSAWRGRGMEFDEVRHYQPGDDIRSIDWRVTARTGKTHTKLFHEEKERPVFVCVDYSHSMHFGSQLLFKSVFAAHVAAAIGWGAIKSGDRIGGLIFDQQQARELKPLGRQRGVLSLIQHLVTLFPETSTEPASQNLNQQLQRLLKLAHPGSDVFIISDFRQLNNDSVALLKGLKRHSSVTALHVSDPFEHALPHAPMQITAQDGTTQVPLPLHNNAFLSAYRAHSQSEREQQQALFKQAAVPVLGLSAALPLQQQLWYGKSPTSMQSRG
ncbi:DUF58 domain-containing protein [Aliidiomarina taiwanensis]|uniref:DUF58 domain-containing protein n=1 Tax=Aliidiomarina taiwanensis TaxID=946228 RepID=A0A432X946_9GAMM|nr:DUF58 domain-containing protein [Aliidiomarina taiwanensis]RUO43844.1 DUF58 domain-containing protein [Aliidiomarina taiwanensis]